MTIAIIDGDVLCYQACKTRWDKRSRIQDDTSIVSLDEDGRRLEIDFTPEEDQDYLEESWENFKIALANLLDQVYCEDYLMAVKGSGNYRHVLYPEYKLHRNTGDPRQNIFVPTIRKLAVKEEYAIEATGRETDDILRIWAEEAKAANQEYVICSIDKDLLCIEGKHWLMHKNSFVEISTKDAMRHYYQQLLKGDPTDNIPGVPRIGDVKAARILSECKIESEFQEKVVEQYLIAYGEDKWKDYLLSNAKMIHLQKHKDDYFSFSSWPIVQELG